MQNQVISLSPAIITDRTPRRISPINIIREEKRTNDGSPSPLAISRAHLRRLSLLQSCKPGFLSECARARARVKARFSEILIGEDRARGRFIRVALA